jgi:hypothetical protein
MPAPMIERAQVNVPSEHTSTFERSRLGGHYMEYPSILQALAVLARPVGAVIYGSWLVMS